MDYRYNVLEDVIVAIAKDHSHENIRKQLRRLTTDESRKLRSLFARVEAEDYFVLRQVLIMNELDTDKNFFNIQPKDTSKGHFYTSLIKSIFRIGAGAALCFGMLFTAGLLLIIAELLGIVEELV